MALLRGRRAQQAENALKLGKALSGDWLVFPRTVENPFEPIRPRNVSKRFSILAARYGQPGMRFHDLRHTHGSLQIAAGTPINAVAQRLGHATPNITLAVYGHLFKRSEDQAVAVSGKLLEGVL